MINKFSYFDVWAIGGALFLAGREIYSYAAILFFSAAILSCFMDYRRGLK
tara:strand:- start:18127 stop:18276 length:150 start_codon:yes stop_codon:yes gene_type:complete